WTLTQMKKLAQDIKDYSTVKFPFSGGLVNGKSWWEKLLADVVHHPLKTMVIRILSIVPHAANVRRLFSSLNSIQSICCSNLTIPHMEILGTLCNHYKTEIHNMAVKLGKETWRKHGHMDTCKEPSINTEQVQDLLDTFVWTGPLRTSGGKDLKDALAGPEGITDKELECEFQRLMDKDCTDSGDRLPATVAVGDMYDLDQLDGIRAGLAPLTKVKEIMAHTSPLGTRETLLPAELLQELGLSFSYTHVAGNTQSMLDM
ncbi:hypothetical protein PUNSTDRAFT_73118, partial [Punctularia strigosozonata HHB-11173 SS5]|uniref:uncharacterized protein n=1 Tax=Punctularia strigosozonata (strain HHB-11173) TaxID=741275 RepID=UPI000441704D